MWIKKIFKNPSTPTDIFNKKRQNLSTLQKNIGKQTLKMNKLYNLFSLGNLNIEIVPENLIEKMRITFKINVQD